MKHSIHSSDTVDLDNYLIHMADKPIPLTEFFETECKLSIITRLFLKQK